MKAWHFHNGETLRDGRPLPAVGETLIHPGEPILCQQGLHASVRAVDALQYAPGAWVDRVVVGGVVVKGDDKIVATERTTLWRIDATEILRKFARMCALDVVHLWEAPEIVVRYLKTGDESIRDVSGVTAWNSAWNAEGRTRDAMWSAVESADMGGAAGAGGAWVAMKCAAWAAETEHIGTNKRLVRMLNEEHRKQS